MVDLYPVKSWREIDLFCDLESDRTKTISPIIRELEGGE